MSAKAPFVAIRTDIRKEERVGVIADIAGYNRHEALGRLVELWAWCTDRVLDDAPDDCEGYAVSDAVVRRFLGPLGIDAILGAGCDELALGERRDDGLVYLRGTSETVSRLRDRIRTAGAGGAARAAIGRRESGRFVPTDTVHQRPAGGRVVDGWSERQPETSSEPAATSEHPQPHSGELPPARAIPPSTEYAPLQESGWTRRQRWWAAMLAADARLRRAGIEQGAPPLPPSPAGENERNIHACEKQLLEAGFPVEEVDTRMLHIVAVAEAEALREKSRRYFKPAVIWKPGNANRAADTSLDEARAGPAKPKARTAPPETRPPTRIL